jgi:hypothetical protein
MMDIKNNMRFIHIFCANIPSVQSDPIVDIFWPLISPFLSTAELNIRECEACDIFVSFIKGPQSAGLYIFGKLSISNI